MQGLLLVTRPATAIVALAILVAAVVSAAAVAAAPSPKSLALRKSDLPAGAHRTGEAERASASLPGGLRAAIYAATYEFPRGRKRESVHVVVVAAGSAGKARTVMAAMVADTREFTDTVQHSTARLPSFGDAQWATVIGDPGAGETGGRLWVRQGAVVWGLEISSDPLADDFGLSKPQTLAELRSYARKQQRRAAGR
jgi:hypothetical protein